MDIPIHKTDVLIIGSGGAGLRAAIELHDNNVDVLVVGKCKKREAHTKEAQGGINAALGTMDEKDSWEVHAADTIRDGGGINDAIAVETLCKHAPEMIHELDAWGCPFAKDENGKIIQRFFGAATYRRACFVGSSTGLAILNTLVDQVEKRKIPFQSDIYIFSLLHKNGNVNGALGLNMKTGEVIAFHAKAVILATGGHSRMFKRSSSRFWENNGDGIALAYDLGASFQDMEMFQFHPTGMVFPEEAEGLLITEATRGEGGILTNANGERFMKNYAPESMELSARDVVSRANYFEIEAGRGTENGGVYLDISHKGKDYILERLPEIYEKYLEYTGIDISEGKMEVAPTAHYSMGGLQIDHMTGKVLQNTSKCIPRLYAIGEIAGGVHGGNRLGGNSLAEILVFGRLTSQQILKELDGYENLEIDMDLIKQKYSEFESLQSEKGEDPVQIKKDIQEVMSRLVGVVRDEEGMKQAQKELAGFHDMKLKTGSSTKDNEALIAALDVQNMIPTCEMIIASALERTESRAAHYRRDFPETDETWQKNIICTPASESVEISLKSVEPASESVQRLLIQKKKVSTELLE